jgi:hypothetical protein
LIAYRDSELKQKSYDRVIVFIDPVSDMSNTIRCPIPDGVVFDKENKRINWNTRACCNEYKVRIIINKEVTTLNVNTDKFVLSPELTDKIKSNKNVFKFQIQCSKCIQDCVDKRGNVAAASNWSKVKVFNLNSGDYSLICPAEKTFLNSDNSKIDLRNYFPNSMRDKISFTSDSKGLNNNVFCPKDAGIGTHIINVIRVTTDEQCPFKIIVKEDPNSRNKDNGTGKPPVTQVKDIKINILENSTKISWYAMPGNDAYVYNIELYYNDANNKKQIILPPSKCPECKAKYKQSMENKYLITTDFINENLWGKGILFYFSVSVSFPGGNSFTKTKGFNVNSLGDMVGIQ